MRKPNAERQAKFRERRKLERISMLKKLGMTEEEFRKIPLDLPPLDRNIPMTSAERQKRCQLRLRLEHQLLIDLVDKKNRGKTKPRTRKPTTVKKQSKVQKKTPIEQAFVAIKEESVEKEAFVVEHSTYCRCCFSPMTFLDAQHEATESNLSTFQEIIGISLEPSAIASSFCENCFNNINNFIEFKKLAILKQQKFLQSSSEGGDINCIQHITIPLDPVIKDEKIEEEAVVKAEIIEWPAVVEESFNDFDYEDAASEIPSPELEDNTPKDPPAPKRRGRKRKNPPPPNPPDVESIIFPNIENNKCLQCGVKPRSMKKHLLNHHPIKCHIPKCKFKATEPHEMLAHVQKRHDTKEQFEHQVCPECGKMVVSLQKHIEAIHKKIRNYFCDLCGFSGYERQYLINHMRNIHMKKKIQCQECDFVTISNWRLTLHKRNIHMKKEKTKNLTCNECDTLFQTKTEQRIHIERKHQKLKNFFCSICQRGFYSRTDMKYHHENVHAKKTESICDVCGKICFSPKQFKKHKVTHDVNAHMFCDYCSNNGITKSFTAKSSLKYHIERFHFKKRNYQCASCPKAFYYRDDLKIHELRHKGIKFHCFVPGCKSAVTRKDVLVFHMNHNHSLSPEEKKDFMEKLEAYWKEIKSKIT